MSKVLSKKNRLGRTGEDGFTLTELMLIISVIALVSAAIVAAATTLRFKARDSALIQEVSQYRTLLEENKNDYGNYDNLIPFAYSSQTTAHWFSTPASCTDGTRPLTGKYAAQAEAICTDILNATAPNAGYAWINGNDEFWVFNPDNSNPPRHAASYSVSVYLPYAKEYYCVSSSNRSSFTKPSYGYTDHGVPFFSAPGCAFNP